MALPRYAIALVLLLAGCQVHFHYHGPASATAENARTAEDPQEHLDDVLYDMIE